MARLHSLFLKPSLQCTARCVHCERRREFYDKRKGPPLTIDHYRSIIAEARSLGAASLHLSGGEPTLYRHLAELVSEGSRAGMFTILNTNGSLLTRDSAKELLEAGLRSVNISIHSHVKSRHDDVRGREGNFDEVVSAVGIFRELRDSSFPGFILSTQTIVTKSNFMELADIIDLVCSLDVDAHGLSYLEGDFDLERSPDGEDVETLRSTVIPEVVSRLARFKFKNPILKRAAMKVVSRLYGGSPETRRRMSRGAYRRVNGPVNCREPNGFAMVLAEGSVLPCNMVEYTDGPILGNVFEEKLGSIMRSDAWKNFARTGYEYCVQCPLELHFHIPLSISLRKLLPLAFANPAFEQKSILKRAREGM